MTTDLAAGLASALLGGPWEPAAMQRRCREAVGRDRTPRWLRQLVVEVLGHHHYPPHDAPRELAALLPRLPAWESGRVSRRRLRVLTWTTPASAMGTVPPAPDWPVTPLDDLAALAGLLDVDADELAWLADVQGRERDAVPALCHYRVSARLKRGGGLRVLEIPKPRLREAQRRLLRSVVAPIPTHAAAHGAVPGRSVATALAPHAGNGTVLRVDLAQFFASVRPGRVWGVLRSAGYPEAVAHTITGLVTTSVSRAAWTALPGPSPSTATAHRSLGRALATAHLPQGAPTSPGLANLVAYRLDVRLVGLAAALDARYTRYVDDLQFSGAPKAVEILRRRVPYVVAEEGFAVTAAKTVVLSPAGRQQLLGAVINQRPTLARPAYDALRAVLHNCQVHGPAGQARDRSLEDFRAALTGRVAWVNGLDPARGARLRAQLVSIDWDR